MQRKIKIFVLVLIIFIFILTLFGSLNIYKSTKIINKQANSNFVFLAEGIKKSANKYFHDAQQEAEICNEVIKLTLDYKMFKKITPTISKYEKEKIPYLSEYMDKIVSPLLLYTGKTVDGLQGIYFLFDYQVLIRKDLIGSWYIKNDKGDFEYTDSGFPIEMMPENLPSLQWFYSPKKFRKGVWSKPYTDRDIGINMITYSTPLTINGEFLGVIGVDISFNELKKFMSKFEIYKSGKAYLVGNNGEIIYSQNNSFGNNLQNINKDLSIYLNSFLKNKELKPLPKKIITTQINDKVFAICSLYNGYILVVEVSHKELYGEITKLVSFNILLLILSALISIFIALYTFKKLKNINDELMHKEKLISLGTMAAEVAHEINNPLGYINCNIDTLKKFVSKAKNCLYSYKKSFKYLAEEKSTLKKEIENLNKIEQELKIDYVVESIDDIIDETKDGIIKVASIILNLKNFSKKGLNDYKVTTQATEIIDGALKILETKIPNNIKIKKNIKDEQSFYCNKSQLIQVVVNMIDNSCHSLEEKNSSEKTICLNSYTKSNSIFIEIEDNGTGIDKKDLTKIFNAFYTTKGSDKGTGLGLSIAYDIIKNNHKGDILVDSKNGKGCKFTIKIPIKKEQD